MKNVQQTQARELYFQAQMTQQQIAELLDVNRKTVGLWIQEGQWRQMRIAAQQSPGIILQDFYNQLSALNTTIYERGGIPTLEESVIQRRLMMSIKGCEQQSASNYMQVYTELVNHIMRQDPDLAQQVVKHSNEVIRQKVSNKKMYNHQDMFIDDEIEDEANMLNGIAACNAIDRSAQTQCPQNETFCDISENDNNTESKEVQPTKLPGTIEENNIENGALSSPAQLFSSVQFHPALPGGLIWLADGMVYDPAISKKREISFAEMAAFKELKLPSGILGDW